MRLFVNTPLILLLSFLLFVAWMIGGLFVFIVTLGLVTLGLVPFRRISPSYREDFVLKDGIFYAPVNGKVSYFRKDVTIPESEKVFHEIAIVSSWWNEGGMYLPIRSEVIDLSYEKGKSFFRYLGKAYEKTREGLSRLNLEFRCSNGDAYFIKSLKCPTGMWPKVRVVPGDRGKAQVNFGFFGLGGTTILYIPQNYEILVKDGLDTSAGQTIMASLNEELIKEDK